MADADLESNSSLFNNLCDELLSEVLVRLSSTAAAVRLQVVCKRWYSLISSPYFSARFIHLRHHTDVESSSSLVIQNSYYCDLPSCSKFHSDFQIISDHCSSSLKVYVESARFVPAACSLTDRHNNVQLEASFADLILCSYITNRKQINYYVSNLETRKWVTLPPPPADKGFMHCAAVGFLCVPPPCSQCNCKPVVVSTSHHKFMVVRLCVSKSFSEFKVQVFSWEDSSVWRSLVVSSPRGFKFRLGGMPSLVAYRGMLHWLNRDCILVYDPLNTPETFSRIIHLPIQSPLPNNICINWCLAVCQGHLRLVLYSCEDAVDPPLDVWELGDYSGSGLWNLVHKVYLQNLRVPIGPEGGFLSIFCPYSIVSLHPQNGDVVYLGGDNGVVVST